MDARRTRHYRQEGGFTMTELLIGAATSMIVLLTAAMVLDLAVKNQPRVQQRNDAIQESQVVLDRLARELRQAYAVVDATPASVTVLTYARRASCNSELGGGVRACRVTYACSGGTCTRSATESDGSGTPAVHVVTSGLTSDAVFAYAPDPVSPATISVSLSYGSADPAGDDAISAADSIALRNVAAGAAG